MRADAGAEPGPGRLDGLDRQRNRADHVPDGQLAGQHPAAEGAGPEGEVRVLRGVQEPGRADVPVAGTAAGAEGGRAEDRGHRGLRDHGTNGDLAAGDGHGPGHRPRPNRCRVRKVTDERAGSTRYRPAAGTLTRRVEVLVLVMTFSLPCARWMGQDAAFGDGGAVSGAAWRSVEVAPGQARLVWAARGLPGRREWRNGRAGRWSPVGAGVITAAAQMPTAAQAHHRRAGLRW